MKSYILNNFYGSNLERDLEAYLEMMKRVEQIKKDMGDRYLLARHIPKKDLTKEKHNRRIS